MFIHTLETLEEFEDYIEQLEETVGLKPETYQEVKKAISKERDKLKN
jgi:glucuronate isomerase